MRLGEAALAAALFALAPRARAEWVLTLYTGASHTYASTLHISQSSTGSDAEFASVAWAAHPFALGLPYFGARLAWSGKSTAHVAALIDFTHYKMYAETAERVRAQGLWGHAPFYAYVPLGTFVQHLEISHGVNLTSLGAEYRWNPGFGDGPWQPHIGAGLDVYLPQAEGTIGGVGASSNYQYAGWGAQLFAGTEYALPRRWGPRWMRIAALLESKLDHGNLDMDLDPSTDVRTRVTTLHLIGGLSLHFD